MNKSFIELLRTRRSIRKFTNKKIKPKLIEMLKEAILNSPSSRGNNPWEFIFVENKTTLEKLSKAKKHGGDFIKSAALAVVIYADESKSDVWIEDCSIAAIIAQLAVHSIGLGSCWVQIRNRQHSDQKSAEEFIRDTLSIPNNMKIGCVVAIGYPDKKIKNIAKKELDYNKICMI